MQPTGSMELHYAEQFTVDYYEGGLALITIAGTDRFLLVPESAAVPSGLDGDITVLRQPCDRIYLASSSVMDLFSQLEALDVVCFTSTKAADWTLEEVQERMEDGSIVYAGKYSAPDYELVLSQGCTLAVENTMIYHSPQTREQLESLGIPVLVERSSYESHPLGRLEWIRLYGLLTGKQKQADTFFFQQEQAVQQTCAAEPTGKTVAFFYLTPNGAVNIRKSGDYVSKMIQLAGGEYLFPDLPEEENALATMNIQMETFYAKAKDADYLIYNSTVAGKLEHLDQLLALSGLFGDFKAVQNGNLWCTEQNLFQRTSCVSGMIEDIHAVVADETDGADHLTYLYRLR
jgi:iron complex transport system substrate-binding protein